MVIPAKNRQACLDRLLSSVQTQTYQPVEVVVVDDGSSLPLLTPEWVRCIRSSHSQGPGAARNMGVSATSGAYVVFLDDDAELVEPDFLARAVALSEALPQVGVIGFCQVDSQGDPHYMQPGDMRGRCYAPCFFGYGALLRRSALEVAGLFYEPMGYGFEEMELSLRLLDCGFPIIFDPSLRVRHYQDPVGRNLSRINRLMLRGNLFTHVLRYPWPLFLVSVPIHVVRHIGWTGTLRGVLEATLEALHNLPTLLRDRKPVRCSTLFRSRSLRRHPQFISVPQ